MKPYEKREFPKETMYVYAAGTSRSDGWKKMLYEVMETGSATVRDSVLAAYPAQQDVDEYDLQWPYSEMNTLPAMLVQQTDDNTYKVALK